MTGEGKAMDDKNFARIRQCAFDVYESYVRQGQTAMPEQRMEAIGDVLNHALGLAALAQAQQPGEDKPAAVPKGFKPVYVKRWRTLIVVSEAHADKVREALAPPPQVDSGRGPTAEDIYACAQSTLIGFRDELTEDQIKFICDQISRKATMPDLALRPERSGGRGA